MVNLVEVDSALLALGLSPGAVFAMNTAGRRKAFKTALDLKTNEFKKPSSSYLSLLFSSPTSDDAPDTDKQRKVLEQAKNLLMETVDDWYVVQFGSKYCLLDYASFNQNQLYALKEALPSFKSDPDLMQAAETILSECLPNGKPSPKVARIIKQDINRRLYYFPTIWRQLIHDNWIYSYASEKLTEQQYRYLIKNNASKHTSPLKLVNPFKALTLAVCLLLTPFIAGATAVVNNIDRLRDSKQLKLKSLGFLLTASAAILGYFVLGVVGTVNSVLRLLNHPYNLTKYYVHDRKTKDKSLEDILVHGVFMLFSCIVLYNLFTLVLPGMHEFGFRVALEINMSITTAIKTFCGFTHAQINKNCIREEASRLPDIRTPHAKEVSELLSKIEDRHEKNSFAFKFFGNKMLMKPKKETVHSKGELAKIPSSRLIIEL